MYLLRNIKARSRNRCCSGKAVSITYSEFVSVGLVMQHAKRMRRVIFSFVACLALRLFFARCLINGMIFRKKLLNTKCVF